MFGKSLFFLSALSLAAVPASAADKESKAAGRVDAKPEAPKQDSTGPADSETGGQSFGDRNRGGPYGFYSYPRHRHVDRGGAALDRSLASGGLAGTSPTSDRNHGSAYYGRDYGAPYFGGGYYDQGVYYRERRDR